jgi:glyoxylase-like metal-dependent hydrolase (beta-lactamase superfamily II)
MGVNMVREIKCIVTKSVMSEANCYLIKACNGFVLIDTVYSTSRSALEKELENAICKPEDIRLVILTHGVIDHTGNCAYLQKKYGAMVATHGDDSGIAEYGDMSYYRSPNPILSMAL